MMEERRLKWKMMKTAREERRKGGSDEQKNVDQWKRVEMG